jgi:hypothetical protein
VEASNFSAFNYQQNHNKLQKPQAIPVLNDLISVVAHEQSWQAKCNCILVDSSQQSFIKNCHSTYPFTTSHSDLLLVPAGLKDNPTSGREKVDKIK